ncbi:M48 family metallopeptidase [Megamonas hypermegale]|uniref:M48 family metallopeptidase n=1 Tax=Megamonas hypermegale TaxID=158847 RepID=UPI00255C2F0E|nr:SprT family zinc-dependent metalloprotease [Megamonas hypermegale]
MKKIIISNLSIEVEKKSIKNMYIKVLPPDGKVVITAPKTVNDDVIRMFVISKINWIKNQKQKFENQPRQTKRQYVTGESYYLWGRRYRLDVQHVKNNNNVILVGDKIILEIRKESTVEQRAKVLNEWYRQQLKEKIPRVLKKCENIVGVKAIDCRIKNMKTKWGTCNIEKGRIWINLQLVKKTPRCLEYVIIHELIHLLERHHNERFYKFMDLYYPNWKVTKDLLNQQMLDYFE